MPIRIDEAQSIRELLSREFPQAKERTRRQMVEFGRVVVNGRPAKSLKQPLKPGDVVEIAARVAAPPTPVPTGIKLLHEDEDILVVEKISGLLTSTTPDEKRPTVAALMKRFVQASGSGEHVWVVHRLDKDASGLLVLAKTEQAWRWLKDDFRARRVQKAYSVVVEGRVEPPPGHATAARGFRTIQSFLRENARNRMESLDELPADDRGPDKAAKLAVTNYRVEQTGDRYSLLRVTMETGRKHQIRVHLAKIGHPVVGDVEYGTRAAKRGDSAPLGRLGLHACELSFTHPRNGQTLRFESAAPAAFQRAVREQA